MMVKVAACLIVKATDDEAPLLDKALESIKDHVDAIYIQLNAPKGQKVSQTVRTVAEKYTKEIKVFVWEENFVAARRANFAQVPKRYDWVFWMDTDDTVENPEKIKETAAIAPKSVSAVYACYDYAHDEYGNVTVPHYVARMVRNNGSYDWKSSIDDEKYSVHETLSETRSTARRVSEEFKVVHHAKPERGLQSLYRNLDLLDKMYKRQEKAGRVDPRILFYLGTHLYDANKFLEAKIHLQAYMQVSGWANERSEALVFLGLIYNLENKPGQAKHSYVLAISEAPNNPRPYVEIAELEFKAKRYDTAAQWAYKAIECKTPPTAMALRPMDGTFRPYVLYAKALAQLGGTRLETAMKYVEKALKLRPLDDEALNLQENLENLIEIRDLNRAYAKLLHAMDRDKDKVGYLLKSTPEKLLNSPLVAQIRAEYTPPKVWGKKSMVIYCGPSVFEEWGPNSLEEGIGGSEEAVIRLSRELAREGWEVHIYATPGKEIGTDPIFNNSLEWPLYNGGKGKTRAAPMWHHYWEFNPYDKFDVLVGWRNPTFYDMEFTARKKYLWMHDVMPKNEFTQERLDNLDKVILLSKYHRGLFPNIPDDKVFLSSNGITPEDFHYSSTTDGPYKVVVDGPQSDHLEILKRDPHRLIYMSSHVRGLQLVYNMWPDIKKAVPEATLDIFYGWESYINVNKDNPERMLWMEEMQRQEQALDGVTDYGKISQSQIVEEIFKSGVWVYPCPFPEVSCITALKAQAGGAIPVSSNFAALDETVQYGAKIPMSQMAEDAPIGQWNREEIEKFKAALINMLKSPKKQAAIRTAMQKWARQQSWKNVAKQWTGEFK